MRMHTPDQGALIARKVPTIRLGLFAHRDYLKAFGVPRSRDDLKRHLFIGPDRNSGDNALARRIAGAQTLRWSVRTDSHPA